MGYWKSKVVPTVKKYFEKKNVPAEEKSHEEVVKTEETSKVEETKPVEVTTGKKEIDIVEEKKEEVTPALVPVSATKDDKKPAVEEEKKVVEEKVAVEEVKKDVTAAPVAEGPSIKASKTSSVLEFFSRLKLRSRTPAAEPQKA